MTFFPSDLHSAEPVGVATIISIQGTVEVNRAGANVWDRARAEQVLFTGDQVRTAERSRAKLRTRDGSTHELDELTIVRPVEEAPKTVIEILKGAISFFHRDKPGSLEIRTRGVSALIRGTELVCSVSPEGQLDLTVLDGVVEITNALGSITLSSGQRGVASPTAAPQPTAVLATGSADALQWLLYYPAIVALEDLSLAEQTRTALAEVLARYRRGDLLGSLAAYPVARQPVDESERVFLAALVLAVGNVEEAERLLKDLPDDPVLRRIRIALQHLMAAAQLKPCPEPDLGGGESTMLATEWMAVSYCRQAGKDLNGALAAARKAVERQPQFGFAWARVAELEFSFGRIRAAQTALNRALELAPDHAPAAAMMGFFLAARYKPSEAEAAFERALQLDSGLGNAWLGRGLMRMRRGDTEAGLADLTVAAATEPQRSLLRSYLGKAYAIEGDTTRATHELDLARWWDNQDPTSWLYTALVHQQRNRINDAVRSFAEAEERNGNRAIYRSRLLLDQDRAVLSANRALAFRDAGFDEIAVREAGRALGFDSAHPSAHLFLANSYVNAERINLRYETARVSEYLQASLLAPVGSGMLSPNLSQQDYSRLFEQDGAHLFSQTAYRSSGSWEQAGGVFGTSGALGYLADAYYASGTGTESNTDFEQRAVEAQAKLQVGDRDTFYLQALESFLDAGDLRTFANPAQRDRSLRVKEELTPILLAGWHRAWSPEHHTLMLGGWFDGTLQLRNSFRKVPAVYRDERNEITQIADSPFAASLEYESESSWLSLEAQHLWQLPENSFSAGARLQSGQMDTIARFGSLGPILGPRETRVRPDGERVQVYAYDTLRPRDDLAITLGLSADWLTFPRNFRSAPLIDGEENVSRVSPKAGFIWQPITNVWLRGAYTRSLGGIGFEQSFRLEPTQVAGFNQTFRSLIPESVSGAVSAERFETAHAAGETRLFGETFAGLQAEWLRSKAARPEGVYESVQAGTSTFGVPGTLIEELEYEERSFSAYFGQLFGRDWSIFANYGASLIDFKEASPDRGSFKKTDLTTHTVGLSGRFNHPFGWFAGADARWTLQTSEGDQALPREDVWRADIFLGYRFWERRAEVLIGVENLFDQDYQLSPLTLYAAPTRERTLVARFKWSY